MGKKKDLTVPALGQTSS